MLGIESERNETTCRQLVLCFWCLFGFLEFHNILYDLNLCVDSPMSHGGDVATDRLRSRGPVSAPGGGSDRLPWTADQLAWWLTGGSNGTAIYLYGSPIGRGFGYAK